MTEPKKHALLIFTKPPLPGLVKTRMTTDFGGFLNYDQAADFYQRCFYDVCEMGMQALMLLQQEKDAAVAADPSVEPAEYHFVVSTTPAERVEDMRELFDRIGPWPMEIHYMADSGTTFDEHFNDAFSQLYAQGYEDIVSIGGDVPTMPRMHVIQAFHWLEYFRSLGTPGFVQAPCQECGTSLVGYSSGTVIDHEGIYYNLDGRAALDGYVEKIEAGNIPCVYFDPVADIDEVTDLAHAISCMKAIEQAAKYQPDLYVPIRTLEWVRFMGITVSTPPNDRHDPRQYLDGREVEDTVREHEDELAARADGDGEAGASAAQDGDIADAPAGQAPTPEELQRIAKGMQAIMDERQKGFDYERAKYN